jgi:Domain of unknown function (DUF4440)
MKRLRFFFMAVLAVTLHAQETSEGIEVTIRALERHWTEAQGHNNNAALNLIFDNALVYVEYGKLVSKAEYLSRVRQELPSDDEVVNEEMSVRVFGTTAIVVGSYRETQRKQGKISGQRWRFIDTWVYKKNGWVLVAAGATTVRH